jgi:hypothetical protein
MYQFFH